MLEVQIPLLDRFLDLLRKAPEVTKQEIKAATSDSGDLIRERAQEESPRDKGELAESIDVFPLDNGIRVGPRAEHALYVHEGTAPHVIEPVSAQALYWPGAEHPVKRVHHPGTKANPFMQRTRDAVNIEVKERFIKAGENIVQSLKV